VPDGRSGSSEYPAHSASPSWSFGSLGPTAGRDRFTRLESRVSPDGAEQWLNWVVRLPTGALAGYVQATIAADRTAHVAYELASRFWRQGIGSTAVSGMLDELTAASGVCAFVATLKARNHRSFALLRKLGFEVTGSSDSDEIVMHKRVTRKRARSSRRTPAP
jgi:RimJ/RimL family protein N-acetyltransferase